VIKPESTAGRIAALTSSASNMPCGTRAKYVGGKCRCRKCRIANTAYQVERDRQKREGVLPDILVSSIAARKHLLKLSAKGIGYKAAADAASVSRSVTGRILWGTRPQIRRSTSERLLAVNLDAVADGARVPSGPTLAILRGLINDGYTKTQLAAWLGSKAKVPTLQMKGPFVTAANASKVQRLSILIEQGKLRRK